MLGRQLGPCHLPRPVCELRAVALPEVPGGRWQVTRRKSTAAVGGQFREGFLEKVSDDWKEREGFNR